MIYSIFRGENRRFTVASGGKGGDSRPESTLLHSSDLGRSAGSRFSMGIQCVKRNASKKWLNSMV